MHLVTVAEGYTDGLKRFEEHFNGREYSNGKCKVRVREIKLYHFAFNECGKDEVLSDIKAFSRHKYANGAQKGTTTELNNKFNKMLNLVKKMFPMIKSVDKELDELPVGPFKKEMNDKGIWFNMALHPIGLVNDYRDKDGRELV
jgi:hypothetical protein